MVGCAYCPPKEIDEASLAMLKLNISMTGHMWIIQRYAAGPFTVENLSPHKVIAVDDDGEFLANANAGDGRALLRTAVMMRLILVM